VNTVIGLRVSYELVCVYVCDREGGGSGRGKESPVHISVVVSDLPKGAAC
jgi:hypothetical protein